MISRAGLSAFPTLCTDGIIAKAWGLKTVAFSSLDYAKLALNFTTRILS
jgi:hypothetical protein